MRSISLVGTGKSGLLVETKHRSRLCTQLTMSYKHAQMSEPSRGESAQGSSSNCRRIWPSWRAESICKQTRDTFVQHV